MRLAVGCSIGQSGPAARAGGQGPRPGCQHCNRAARVQQARCSAPQRRRRVACAAGSGSGDSPQPPQGDGSSSSLPDALPVAGADSDWRTFRAQLVASTLSPSSSNSSSSSAAAAPAGSAAGTDVPWAHPMPLPELGCLLLANPLMFADAQQYFRMSVILIFAHDKGGSAGLILNRPTEYLVGQLNQGAASLQPEFNACQLHLGGDVGADEVHLLHGVAGLKDSVEVLPGVYLGGFLAAKQGLGEGRFSADQFKVLTRYAGWGPGQLESECARGVWLPVAASRHVVLQQLPKGAPVDGMWYEVAELANGDLAALSRGVRGVPDPDISRAAGGGLLPEEDTEESEERGEASGHTSSRSSAGSPSRHSNRWQQPQLRRRLPEADYRDGAGI